MAEAVLMARPEPGVASLTINRPEARNALNDAVRAGLIAHLAAAAEDPEIRAVVVTGGSDIFVAGADIMDMAEADPMAIRRRKGEALWRAIRGFPKPLIAAVNGYALGGGCELALACDIIVAGRSAQFGQPEPRVGIMAGGGATQRLMRALGKHKAMKLLLTAKPISAEEAERAGLVSELTEDEETLATALAMARGIARLPAVAIEQTKEVALLGEDAPLETALQLERKAFQLLFATDDQKEGMAAFIEKRRPEFKGG